MNREFHPEDLTWLRTARKPSPKPVWSASWVQGVCTVCVQRLCAQRLSVRSVHGCCDPSQSW